MARKVWKRKKGANLNSKLNAEHHFEGEKVQCYFRDLEDKLVQFIDDSEAVVICMAWMTSKNIMMVLETKPCVLILQNESWLNKKGGLAKKTRELYSKLRTSKKSFPVMGKTIKKDIRVAGLISHPQNMHHKFVVRLDEKGNPLAVWTGSYNPTTNGNESIENALVLHNEEAARAYLKEFNQVYKLSKPLKV